MWMSSLLFTLLAGIVALGPVNHLGLPRWLEISLGLLLVGLGQHYFLHRFFHASILAPDAVPLPLLQISLWGAAFLMSAGFFTILTWILILCRVPVPQWTPLVLGVIVGSLMIYLGERVPTVKEHSVYLEGLPAEAEGARIAVIADLHIDCWRGADWCTEIVRRVNDAQPDLILFTGDQFDGTLEARREGLAPLRNLIAPWGKYFITGNHEHLFETEASCAYLESLGMTFLDGRTASTHGLSLIGLPDARSLTQSVNAELLETLVTTLPKETLPILLAHKPGIAPLADTLGIKLQLSGHTHGGQFPGVEQLIGKFNRGLVRGWYTQANGLKVFVAPGSGVWIGFPYRLYPSEISILKLSGIKSEGTL